MSNNSTEDKGSAKTLFNFPFYWREAGLNRSVKGIRFVEDGEGNIFGMPVINVGANASQNEIWMNSMARLNEDTVDQYQTGILVRGANYVYNNVSTAWERQRTPVVYKYNSNLTALSVIWTPTAGKKFRMLGGIITLAKETACAGGLIMQLKDEATLFMEFQISVAALVATGQVIQIPITFPGNGYLSTTVNNHLYLGPSAALTAGGFGMSVWGTEE